ncbi:mechanosensitive ion channel family protein [Salmonella enterica]|nr:mechanosensitive ion channel family protein [Salmonella enterica]
MFTEFFLKNAFNLAILFSCGMALLVVRFWLSRNVQWKKGFTFHAAQFFIYAIIIGTIGSILNNAIEDIVAIVLLYGEHFGMSLSGLLTFGGIGGIAVGMAGKDVLSNFFSGIMLYFDRPFSIGDWIRSPDRNIEGTVAEIGWRITRINTFDHRPLYVPNSVFSSISVENPGRMTNRRIKTVIGLRYEDADKIGLIVDAIRNMLQAHRDIDQKQTLLVYFNEFADSSLNIMVYCFTKTTVWQEWLAVQQDVYLKIIAIVQENGADFAFPSQTLYIDDPEAAPATK